MKTILDRLASAEAALRLIASELPDYASGTLDQLIGELDQYREDLPDILWTTPREEGGEPCEGCTHCLRWSEPYQIGDRTEHEPMSECQATTPHSCPVVVEALLGASDAVPAFLRRQAE